MAKPLPKPMKQPEAKHPDQRTVIAKAGSALVFNGHLWHGPEMNRTVRAGSYNASS